MSRPSSAIDAITLILGLNASGGWRRIGAEGPKALWLRYLKPVLAETRESALALEAALERGELPGTFDPPFADLEPSPLPTLAAAPASLSTSRYRASGPAGGSGGTAQLAALAPSRRLVGAILLLAVLGAAALLVQRGVIAIPGASQGTSTSGGTSSSNPSASLLMRGRWRSTIRVSRSRSASRRPRRLSADGHHHQYGDRPDGRRTDAARGSRRSLPENPVVDEPGIFLAAMLDQAPAEPDLPLALNTSAGTMLRDYAAVAASIESGIPESDFADLIQDANDPALSIDPPAANADVVTAVAGPATWPAWLRYLAFLPLLPALAWSVASLPRAMKAGLSQCGSGCEGGARRSARRHALGRRPERAAPPRPPADGTRDLRRATAAWRAHRQMPRSRPAVFRRSSCGRRCGPWISCSRRSPPSP